MRFYTLSFLVSICFIFLSCTSSKANKIPNEDKYPFIVKSTSLAVAGSMDDESLECTSIILSSKTLLTAAHCVYLPSQAKRFTRVQVKFGGKVYESEKIKWHPLYEKNYPWIYSKESGEIEEKEGVSPNQYLKYDLAIVRFDLAPFNLDLYPKFSSSSLSQGNVELVTILSQTSMDPTVDILDKTTIERTKTVKAQYCPKGSIEIRTPKNKTSHIFIPTLTEKNYGASIVVKKGEPVGITSGLAESPNVIQDELSCYSAFGIKENLSFIKSNTKR